MRIVVKERDLRRAVMRLISEVRTATGSNFLIDMAADEISAANNKENAKRLVYFLFSPSAKETSIPEFTTAESSPADKKIDGLTAQAAFRMIDNAQLSGLKINQMITAFLIEKLAGGFSYVNAMDKNQELVQVPILDIMPEIDQLLVYSNKPKTLSGLYSFLVEKAFKTGSLTPNVPPDSVKDKELGYYATPPTTRTTEEDIDVLEGGTLGSVQVSSLIEAFNQGFDIQGVIKDLNSTISQIEDDQFYPIANLARQIYNIMEGIGGPAYDYLSLDDLEKISDILIAGYNRPTVVQEPFIRSKQLTVFALVDGANKIYSDEQASGAGWIILEIIGSILLAGGAQALKTATKAPIARLADPFGEISAARGNVEAWQASVQAEIDSLPQAFRVLQNETGYEQALTLVKRERALDEEIIKFETEVLNLTPTLQRLSPAGTIVATSAGRTTAIQGLEAELVTLSRKKADVERYRELEDKINASVLAQRGSSNPLSRTQLTSQMSPEDQALLSSTSRPIFSADDAARLSELEDFVPRARKAAGSFDVAAAEKSLIPTSVPASVTNDLLERLRQKSQIIQAKEKSLKRVKDNLGALSTRFGIPYDNVIQYFGDVYTTLLYRGMITNAGTIATYVTAMNILNKGLALAEISVTQMSKDAPGVLASFQEAFSNMKAKNSLSSGTANELKYLAEDWSEGGFETGKLGTFIRMPTSISPAQYTEDVRKDQVRGERLAAAIANFAEKAINGGITKTEYDALVASKKKE